MAASSLRRHGVSLMGLSALFGAGAPPAEARSAWATGTYVYADLCTMAENGMRAGRRVTLRRSPLGDDLVYEAASLPAPVQAATLALDPATKGIDFVVETDDGLIHVRGTLAVDGLTGTVEDEAGTRPVHLPRLLRPHAHDVCAGEAAGETTGSLAARP